MTTGQKCDTIYKVNQRVAHLHGMTLTHRNRAIDGDSGGPWWWGNIAYGVHSGRTPHNILWRDVFTPIHFGTGNIGSTLLLL
jgi:streptogrisin C